MIQSFSEYLENEFESVNLNNSETISSRFQECVFDRCKFTESAFVNCRFIDSQFVNCDLSLMGIPGSYFSGTRFEECKIIGVNWALANWSDLGIWKAIEFNQCALNHSTFLGLEIPKSRFINCELVNVDFREANLTSVDFSNSDLNESLFNSTNLTGSNLIKARNYQIDPTKNKLKNAMFSMPEVLSLLYNMDIEIKQS
jgi:fluoroquinolone resistance protein